MKNRDSNEVKTTTINHWACATREILARIVDGSDIRAEEAVRNGGKLRA